MGGILFVLYSLDLCKTQVRETSESYIERIISICDAE